MSQLENDPGLEPRFEKFRSQAASLWHQCLPPVLSPARGQSRWKPPGTDSCHATCSVPSESVPFLVEIEARNSGRASMCTGCPGLAGVLNLTSRSLLAKSEGGSSAARTERLVISL